jgi:hypothetical protein
MMSDRTIGDDKEGFHNLDDRRSPVPSQEGKDPHLIDEVPKLQSSNSVQPLEQAKTPKKGLIRKKWDSIIDPVDKRWREAVEKNLVWPRATYCLSGAVIVVFWFIVV